MNSAQLIQEKINFYSPEKISDGFGHYSTKWNYEFSARAGVLNKSMNRVIENDEVFYDRTTHFIVRHYVCAKESWRIEWDNCHWRILSIIKNKYYNDQEIICEKIEE